MPPPESAPIAPVPSPRRSWLGGFALGVIYLACLVASALVIARWLPYPEIPGAGEKIRFLERYGNQYDTLFIGSSRVNFQVLPSVFDKLRADAGQPAKSFNAGLLGMRPPEQGYFLDEVLKRPHKRLRWVFIELTSIEARTPKTRRGSARYLAWHDAPRMELLTTWLRNEWAIRRAEGSDLWEPLSVWTMHFGYFCQRTLNLGRGSFVGEAWLLKPSERIKQRNKFRSLGEARDGWLPYDGAREVMTDAERAAYLESYEARLAKPAVSFHDPATDQAIEAMRQAVLEIGATPIFFVPPMTTERHYLPPPEMGRNMIIWNFSDPKRYPQLFLPEHRLDFIHMNTAGGKVFTQALAEHFGELAR